MQENVTGIILAGGKNSRMGVNKAFLEIDGKRLMDRTLSVYRKIFPKIIVVTNHPLDYVEFSEAMIVTDIFKGKGSLGGIYTGLFYSASDGCFVAACDMPFLNEDFIRYMIGRRRSYDIVVPELSEGFQALHAIYSRRCLAVMKKMILANRLKIAGLFKDMRTLRLTEEDIRPFAGNTPLFMNINTPQDLQALRK